MPVFAHLPTLNDLDPDEKLNDSHDADFDIKDDSARKEWVEWFWDSKKKVSELLTSRLNKKNLLEKGQRYYTFDLGKVHFCSIFEVTVTLYINITYKVYWENWEFRCTPQMNGDCSSKA